MYCKKYSVICLIFLLLFIFLPAEQVEPVTADMVYRISIRGEIDPGLAARVDRGIREARAAGAGVIVFEIDTYGGLVDSGVKIRDSIFAAEQETITFVDSRAWSAGALIALAGDRLIMRQGGSIGAAETRPREEKYISALRKEFKATAEAGGKNPELAAAMVDSDIEIEGITAGGKLLTLTAEEALENNFADLVVSDFSRLLAELNLTEARIISYQPTMTEKMAGFVTNPAVSTVLLTLGFLALIFEALVPGWGIGGTVGLLSLGLFFSGYIVNGLASWGLIVLFLVGIVLLFMEAFVVPGFGVTGIGGLTAVLVSLYFTFPDPRIALSVLAAVMVLSIAGTVVLVRIFGGSRFWKNISLGESQTKEAGYVAHLKEKDLAGKRGKSVTPLRPAGTAEIDGRKYDVVSDGGFIDRGKTVEVVSVSGNRIVVREIERK